MSYLKHNQKDNKKFIEEVMQRIVENTDFIKNFDNNTIEDWAIEEKTIDYLCGIDLEIVCGSTRVTILPKNKNFVFKIYFGDEDKDINEVEYNRFIKDKDNIFAECYIEEINILDFSITVLIMEKCFPLDNLEYKGAWYLFLRDIFKIFYNIPNVVDLLHKKNIYDICDFNFGINRLGNPKMIDFGEF